MRRGFLAAVTAAGSGLLGASLASRPGSRRFHTLTASVAATWFAGAGRVPRGRPDVVQPLVVGAGAFGVFYGCALVARHIPPLRRAITGVLDHAHRGSTPSVAVTALVTGVAEEAFFRGALYDAFGARGATAAYVLSTTATRNPALVLASAVMGALFAAQRHRAGGVQAPMLTHVAWSALMLAAMPRLFPPED
ncbi:membrane protease YdiL (CAAX protease family) [Amycolatopsis lexingtonensis]|uniref:Membrane protease YdiL (CAAX protease family) n=1 Tax=Amycolatopsis lexingtonensis TaxID=218822 RepID=A0ABR9HQQ5_9PSEU|nr:CPBP family intramembrane glutamic endopeptidase [Amycolatopsis lexingtonensis]MBE1493087.1 membrane protease YdiL (CAAX protease family) [Amycolatopsis lexingtonensis]